MEYITFIALIGIGAWLVSMGGWANVTVGLFIVCIATTVKRK